MKFLTSIAESSHQDLKTCKNSIDCSKSVIEVKP